MPKGFTFRKPKLRIGTKGIKISAPSVRIGGKTGVNISKSGVSGSVRTKAGSLNTKKGCSIPFMGVMLILALILAFSILT